MESYFYDDSRYIYDEPCMFYVGGFNALCLLNLKSRFSPKKIGKSDSNNFIKNQNLKENILSLNINIESIKLNNNENEFILGLEKQYNLKYYPMEYLIENFQHKINKLEIYNEAPQKVSLKKINFTIHNKNLKIIPIKTIVSSTLSYVKNSNSNILIKFNSIKKK